MNQSSVREAWVRIPTEEERRSQLPPGAYSLPWIGIKQRSTKSLRIEKYERDIGVQYRPSDRFFADQAS